MALNTNKLSVREKRVIAKAIHGTAGSCQSHKHKKQNKILGLCPDCQTQLQAKKLFQFIDVAGSNLLKKRILTFRITEPPTRITVGTNREYYAYCWNQLSLEDQLLFPDHTGTFVLEHRLVVARAMGVPFTRQGVGASGPVVRHLDGNTRNNSIENLVLASQQENTQDHRQLWADNKKLQQNMLEVLGILYG